VADAPLRINKFLSETGVCSRRQADQWVEAGRVAVNGVPAVLGTKVAPGDSVTLDGRPLDTKPARVYLALNKPIGIECTTDRDVPDNIVDFVGHRERIFPIGRLDKESEGLILLTNDGDIVNRVLRAEHEHEKEYIVAVDRPLTREFLEGMASGVPILDTVTNPCRVTQVGRNTFRIVLTQGLNRQIRRMCEHFDYTVRRLQRVRIMHIRLASLPVGKWRNLTPAEIKPLLAQPPSRPRLSLRKAADRGD
jgi:23S rRNA pseudouridine2604 synthase